MHGVFHLQLAEPVLSVGRGFAQLLAFEAQLVTVHLELLVGPHEEPQQALTVKKEPALAP